jgi:hypothetical protein
MTKFGDAECDHVLSIRTADAAKRVWVCSKCGCRFTTWPGTKHWDWPAEAIAARDAEIAVLRGALENIVQWSDSYEYAHDLPMRLVRAAREALERKTP